MQKTKHKMEFKRKRKMCVCLCRSLSLSFGSKNDGGAESPLHEYHFLAAVPRLKNGNEDEKQEEEGKRATGKSKQSDGDSVA